MNTIAIDIKDLCRTYSENGKDVVALDRVNFSVNKGEIFALLGPNGAGKTTIIKILTTLLAPTSGNAYVFGHDCYKERKKVRKSINFVFGGEAGLYWRLSGRENLQYFADLYKVPTKIARERMESLLKIVELDQDADKKVEQYSKGMKQRLLIARGLINDPEILFLDEPTIGLDPIGAASLRKLIQNMNEMGKTILITTHYMNDVEVLCDRIAFINKGRLIDIGAKNELKKKYLGSEGASVEDLYIKLFDQE